LVQNYPINIMGAERVDNKLIAAEVSKNIFAKP
jgi:hypothetical protein